jgi:outer membrane protein assembly factor BamB
MKIRCSCGTKYEFDITPEMAQNPVRFVCPNCGLDSSDYVNQLVRQEIAEQFPNATPPPQPAAASRLKIAHEEKPAEAPPEAAPVSKHCQKHRGVLATEKCTVCGKPICPQCMAQFGFFCSPFCQNKADLHGIAAPVYAGQKFKVEARFWRKIELIFGSIAVAIVLFFVAWIWYAWFGSVPHPYFSVRFDDADRAYSGSSQLVGKDQIVFLHGSTLARYDLKTKKQIWSQELITPDQITGIVKSEEDRHARDNQAGGYDSVPPPGSQERGAKIMLQDALTLHVSGEDIWVASPGKLTHYDWNTGKILQETALPGFAGAGNNSTGGGLFSDNGQPLDPDKVAEQVQSLSLPARIALPALLGNAAHEQQLEAALRDDPQQPRTQNSNPAQREMESFRLIPTENGFVQFSSRLLEKNIVTREAMKAPPKKSALDDNLSVGKSTEAVNETLNEIQRSRGGDTVSEDDSRYQVTIHIPNAPDTADWTGEVVGPPQLFLFKTVNVIAAGKTVIVLDKSNKKLWQAALTYNVSTGGGFAGREPRFGAGPCAEHGDTLYVFDQAVLSAFDLATGNARWRLPSIGVVGLFFDDQDNVYVNTTTGNPDDIRYSRQIDITKSTEDVLLKIDQKTGRTLWSVKPGGFISYLSGKFIYTVESYDPNPTDEEVLSDSLQGLQKPPYLHIARINPKNGRVMWEHYQDRCPVDVRFDDNSIELVFKREVQVLKYLTL